MTRVITLAIETSNPSAVDPEAPARGSGPGVALGSAAPDGSSPTLLGVEFLAPDRPHDDDLVPAIDRLTRRLGVHTPRINRVAVSVGPGGFTALRIAIAAAKMIAEVAGARCVAVPSAHVAARRVPSASNIYNGLFGVALASKDDSAFVTRFDPKSAAVDPGRLMIAADLASLDLALLVADRYLPTSIRAALRPGVGVVEPIFDPGACFEASLTLADLDPIELLPIYPREPEAVRKWRELGRAAAARTPPPARP